MFDPAKQYQTRNGKFSMRYLATINNGENTVWAKKKDLIGEVVSCRRDDGKIMFGIPGHENPMDVVPVVKKSSLFSNIYSFYSGAVKKTLEECDVISGAKGRIGVLERLFEDGICVGAVFHPNEKKEEGDTE